MQLSFELAALEEATFGCTNKGIKGIPRQHEQFQATNWQGPAPIEKSLLAPCPSCTSISPFLYAPIFMARYPNPPHRTHHTHGWEEPLNKILLVATIEQRIESA